MIDKVKLIEKFLSEGWSGRVVKIVENFAEESEIDFDRLRNKFGEEKCNEADCHLPMCNKIECYTNFLKSKHLSASKPKQLPVKKYWTLKKELLDFVETVVPNLTIVTKCETEPKYTQYYDLHEEPDYSKIPVGAYIVVKFKEFNRSKCGVVYQHYMDFFNIDTGDNQHSVPYNGDGVESIEILKMPENVK